MIDTTELAKGIYRIALWDEEDLERGGLVVPGATMNLFLIKAERPAILHTMLRRTFQRFRDRVREIVAPRALRYIVVPHHEGDSSGALNDWLAAAPEAVPLCSELCALLSLRDLSDREVRVVNDGEVVDLGSHRLRFLITPQVNQWDQPDGLRGDNRDVVPERSVLLSGHGGGLRRRPLAGRSQGCEGDWLPAERSGRARSCTGEDRGAAPGGGRPDARPGADRPLGRAHAGLPRELARCLMWRAEGFARANVSALQGDTSRATADYVSEPHDPSSKESYNASTASTCGSFTTNVAITCNAPGRTDVTRCSRSSARPCSAASLGTRT